MYVLGTFAFVCLCMYVKYLTQCTQGNMNLKIPKPFIILCIPPLFVHLPFTLRFWNILSEALLAVTECPTVGHFLGISQYLRPAEWRIVHRRGNGFLAGDAVLIYTLYTCKAGIRELFRQMTIKMGMSILFNTTPKRYNQS